MVTNRYKSALFALLIATPALQACGSAAEVNAEWVASELGDVGNAPENARKKKEGRAKDHSLMHRAAHRIAKGARRAVNAVGGHVEIRDIDGNLIGAAAAPQPAVAAVVPTDGGGVIGAQPVQQARPAPAVLPAPPQVVSQKDPSQEAPLPKPQAAPPQPAAAAAAADTTQQKPSRLGAKKRTAACNIFHRERTLISGAGKPVFRKNHTLIASKEGTFAPSERLELDDDFVNIVLAKENKCPMSQEEVLKLAKDKTSRQQVFVVAEDGDRPQADKIRFVFSHGPASEPHLFMSAIGSILKKAFTAPPEVIAFDKTKRAYNYYQLTNITNRTTADDPEEFASDGPYQWVYVGDGHDYQPGVHPTQQKHECIGCHTVGGLNMKELALPWTHWHSFSDDEKLNLLRTKVVAAAGRSDSTSDLKMMAQLISGGVGGAESFESFIFSGQQLWATSRLETALRGEGGSDIDLSMFYEQLLCDRGEPTLQSSGEPHKSRFGSLRVASTMSTPTGFLLDATFDGSPMGLSFSLGMQVRHSIAISPQHYADAAANHFKQGFAVAPKDGDFTITGGVEDTKFPFFVPVTSFADQKARKAMVAQGILDNDLARSVLMVDFSTSIFSSERCGLMATFPKTFNRSASNKGPTVATIRAEWTKNLESSPLPAAKQLLATMKQSKAEAQMQLDTFAGACSARASSDPKMFAQDMMTIAAQRRREFLSHYGSIVESNELFPFDGIGIRPGQFKLDPATCALVPGGR